MRKCEGRKIEFRHIKVSRERTDQSVWSQWSAWSSCSVTCGNGLRYYKTFLALNNFRLSLRRRRCLSETCIGFDQVSRDCNLSSCSVPTRPPLNCGNISEVQYAVRFQSQNYFRDVVLVSASLHFRVRVFASVGNQPQTTTLGHVCPNLRVSLKDYAEVTNCQEIDAELPKSYDECDQWEFLIDGRPMSDAECRGSGWKVAKFIFLSKCTFRKLWLNPGAEHVRNYLANQ